MEYYDFWWYVTVRNSKLCNTTSNNYNSSINIYRYRVRKSALPTGDVCIFLLASELILHLNWGKASESQPKESSGRGVPDRCFCWALVIF